MGYILDLQDIEDALYNMSKVSIDHKDVATDLLNDVEDAKYNEYGLVRLQAAASYYMHDLIELGYPEIYEAIVALNWDY